MRGRIKLRIRQRITVRALSKVFLPRKRRPGVIAARKARHLRARTGGTAATSPLVSAARTTHRHTRRRRTHTTTHTHTTTTHTHRVPQSTSSPRARPPWSRAPSPNGARMTLWRAHPRIHHTHTPIIPPTGHPLDTHWTPTLRTPHLNPLDRYMKKGFNETN